MAEFDLDLENPFRAPTTDLSVPEPEQQPELAGTTSPVAGNPFLTMWFRPRATIRKIVNTNPKRHVFLLSSLSLTCLLFVALFDRAQKTPPASVLPTASIIGLIVGLPWVYVCGLAMKLAGRLVGGKARMFECRAAIAWSGLTWIAMGILSVGIWFAALAEGIVAPLSLTHATIAGFVFIILILVWYPSLLIRSLAEVHRISSWRMFVGVMLFSFCILMAAFLLQVMFFFAFPLP